MEVRTPKHWATRDLVKTTTAYGNEVMIPKEYIRAWEEERWFYEEVKKDGEDASIGVEKFNQTPIQHERRNALLVFYEKYQKEE